MGGVWPSPRGARQRESVCVVARASGCVHACTHKQADKMWKRWLLAKAQVRAKTDGCVARVDCMTACMHVSRAGCLYDAWREPTLCMTRGESRLYDAGHRGG